MINRKNEDSMADFNNFSLFLNRNKMFVFRAVVNVTIPVSYRPLFLPAKTCANNSRRAVRFHLGKMVKSCALVNCKNSSIDKYRFFSLPSVKKSDKRRKWIDNCGNLLPSDETLKPDCHLCEVRKSAIVYFFYE